MYASPARPRSALFLAVLCAVALVGCEKISSEAKALLQSSALGVKESATSFRLHADSITAKNAAHAIAIEAYKKEHLDVLSGQAKGLAELVDAANEGDFKQSTREQLQDLAEKAKACAENWRGMLEFVNIDAEYAEVHAKVLEANATTLAALAEKLKPKEK